MLQKKISRRHAIWLGAALATKAKASPQHPMFLALNSQLTNSRVHWPEFAKLAASTAYRGADVMLAPAMQAGADATNNLLRSLKLLPAAIDFPVEFRKTDAEFEAGIAQLPAQAKFAAQIGCPRMVTYIMPSSNTPRDHLRALYKQRFTRSAAILAQHNVRLGLEFLGPLEFRKAARYEFIWRMNDMLEFAKECGPNVGLLLDSWHWHLAGATTDDIIHTGKDRIVHVHFNDAPNIPPDQIRDNHRLLPGEGAINLVGFVRALHQIGYTDALSIEVFGRLNDVPPEQAARMGLAAGQSIFRKAGVPEMSLA